MKYKDYLQKTLDYLRVVLYNRNDVQLKKSNYGKENFFDNQMDEEVF